VVTLAIHGANWIILKTNSSINEKLKSVIFKLNIALAVLTIISLLVWHLINPDPFSNFIEMPLLLIFPILYLGGLFGLFFIKKMKNELAGFIYSSLVIVGGIATSVVSMFPVILPSTNTLNESLTIYNTSTSQYGFSIAIYWGIAGFILLAVYIIFQKKMMSGKIDEMDYGH